MKTMKRFFLVLMLAATAAVLAVSAGAGDDVELPEIPIGDAIIDQGSCGETLYWRLYENGLLEICGEGEMYDYSWRWGSDDMTTAEWGRYIPTRLRIADGVTYIGSSAFHYCRWFTGELIIPDSVTRIGSGAFRLASGFSSLTLSKNLTSIPYQGFYGCWFSGDLIIPDSVTSIGYEAFVNGLRDGGHLVIGPNVKSIGTRAFNAKLIDAVFRGDAPTASNNIFNNAAEDFVVYCYQSHAESFTSDDNYDASTGTWYGYRLEILPDSLPGDLDGDGSPATPRDAMVLARYIAGWDGYAKQINLDAADLDGDGVPATPRDAMVLARHIAGWDGYETIPLKP